jgi:hypothetical protein
MYMAQAQKDFHMGIDFLEMKYKLIIEYQNYYMQGTWKRGGC